MILSALAAAALVSPVSALEPLTEDYSKFIAAEAKNVAAKADSEALARALGIADLLSSRASEPPRVGFSAMSAPAGLLQQRMTFGTRVGTLGAVLLEPAGGGKHPAVLLLHDSVQGAVDAREILGRRLAERGYAVLMPERAEAGDPGREFDDAFNLLLVGRSLPGVRVYERVILLDHLASRPEVDASRLAVAGLGSGGVLARLVAAVDPRIKAAAVDSTLVDAPYYDWSADLLAPGLLRHALAPLSAPLWTGQPGFPGGALADWLAKAFAGKAGAARQPAADDQVARLFAAYKGYVPGGPDDVLSYNLALSLRRAGKTKEAVAELERGLKRQPDRPLLLRALGETYELAGERGKAAEVMARLAGTTPDRGEESRVRASLARLFMRLGRLSAAEEQFAAALKLDPERQELRGERARALVRLGRAQEAREQLAELVKRAPDQAQPHLELARQLASAGDLDGAAAHAERAAALAPDLAEAHLNLARIRETRGEHDAAERELKAAWTAEPGFVQGGLTLAGFYAERKRWPEALALYRDLVKQAPGVVEARTGYAAALGAQGDVAGAEREMKAALALDRNVVLDLGTQTRRCEALQATIRAVSALAK